MLGGASLVMAPAWAVRSLGALGEACRTSSGLVVAPSGSGALLLLNEQGTAEELGQGRMPAAGAKGAPLLLACDGAGGLLRLGLEPPSSTPVALQTPGAAPVAAIACQEAASVFAVAMGR